MKTYLIPDIRVHVMRVTERIGRKEVIIALAAIMVWVAGFAHYFLYQSLRLDEAQSLWQVSRPPGAILQVVAQDVHVPLYHEILHVWLLTFGNTVTTARLLSLVFFMCAIAALYVLGSYLYTRATGLLAALFFALSPFMNWYGSEIRMYTLLTLVTILSHYFFLKLFKGEVGWVTVGYAVSALLGIYTHYFFFLVLLTQALFLVAERHSFPAGSVKRFVLIWGGLAILFIPWVFYLFSLGQGVNQEPLLAPPTSVNVFSTFSQFVFGFQDDRFNTVILSLWPLVAVFGFLTLRGKRKIPPETEYFILALFIPIVGAFLISVFIKPIFLSRYLIFTIPALFLLLANAFSFFSKSTTFLARSALVGIMLMALTIEITSPTTIVKEDYRDASEYLMAHAGPKDIVLLSAPFTLYPVQYYYRGTAPLATIPEWDQYAHGALPAFIPDELPKQATALTQSHAYAWLLLSYDQGYQKTVQEYFDTHYLRVYSKTFSSNLTLYGYKLPSNTPLAQKTTDTHVQ